MQIFLCCVLYVYFPVGRIHSFHHVLKWAKEVTVLAAVVVEIPVGYRGNSVYVGTTVSYLGGQKLYVVSCHC